MDKNSCILYFTLTPESEAFRKKLSHSRKANLKVIQKLYNHTKNVILDSKIDYIEINEETQKGLDFGSRLHNAISDVLDLGYENVIVLGNDCIDIEKEDLLQAQSELELGHHTIGKTVDGGVYIFTVSKDSFDTRSFRELSWSQKTLGSELHSWLISLSKVCLLRTKRDINTLTQLLSWTNVSKHRLVNVLRSIILYISEKINSGLFTLLLFLRLTPSLRGPPIML